MRTSNEIVTAVRKIPNNPDETLNSRRQQLIEIRGDAMVFPLEENTTNPEFVKTIKDTQKKIYEIIERDLNLMGKTWADKESRHRDKSYKKQKKLHLAFLGTIPPSGVEEYNDKKSLQTTEKIENACKLLLQLINQDEVISGNVKECKLNSDGHIVVRINIHPAEKLINCKEELAKVFGITYIRHTDPEKQSTLAAVICVVDFNKLSTSAREALESSILHLEKKLQLFSNIPFKSIEWIDYRKRTLSEKSRLKVRTITRTKEEVQPLQLVQASSLLICFLALAYKGTTKLSKLPRHPDLTITRRQYSTTKRSPRPIFRGLSPIMFFPNSLPRNTIFLAQKIVSRFRK